MKDQLVLVVEDEDDIRELVGYNLFKEGLRVTGVRSGEEGLQAVEKEQPSLILLDLHFRSGDGELKGLAVEEMLTSIFRLGQQLSKVGAGIPFDHLSMGYAIAPTPQGNLNNARALLKEADTLASKIQTDLPTDYPFGMEKALIDRIDAIARRWQQTA